MQHPPSSHFPKNKSAVEQALERKYSNPVERYAAIETARAADFQGKHSSDWFVDSTHVNPLKIIEEAKSSPHFAAFMCQYACIIISKNQERSIREYVVAAYAIAYEIMLNEISLKHLARDIRDGRYKNGVPIDLIKGDILHYVFIYIFFQSKIRTRDRATQYAQGLKEYFAEGRPYEAVRKIVIEHGPDRLRRVAQRQAKLIEGAKEWAKRGKSPASPSMDEVLAIVVAEETKAATGVGDDETADHGSRDLPPDGSINEESDADWIAEAEHEEARKK